MIVKDEIKIDEMTDGEVIKEAYELAQKVDITPSKCEPDRCPYWWFEQANARWRCKINNIPALDYARQQERERVLASFIEISQILPRIPNSAICDPEALLYIPACTVNKINKIIADELRGTTKEAPE